MASSTHVSNSNRSTREETASNPHTQRQQDDEAVVGEQPESSAAIEPHVGPEEEDEFVAEVWDAGSATSTSVTSSVYAHTYQNGRRYHAFRHGRYPIPNDDLEQNREDMKHALMLELTDGKLFYAPVGWSQCPEDP
jgi:hypothetical protein